MAMPRQSHPCTCEECLAAQRVSAMILTAFAGGVMVIAIVACLIFS